MSVSIISDILPKPDHLNSVLLTHYHHNKNNTPYGCVCLCLGLGMVTPVNDLRGSDSIAYDKGEKLLRCKLAAFYRLADLFGWSQLIYNHLTVSLKQKHRHQYSTNKHSSLCYTAVNVLFIQ